MNMEQNNTGYPADNIGRNNNEKGGCLAKLNPKKNPKGCVIGCVIFIILFIVGSFFLGIFLAIALPQYFKAVEKSRAVEAISYLQSLSAAQERYRLAGTENIYANDLENLDIIITDRDGEAAKGSSFRTKNFAIEVISDPKSTARIEAKRIYPNNDTEAPTYTITRFLKDGKITCTDGNISGMCNTLAINVPKDSSK